MGIKTNPTGFFGVYRYKGQYRAIMRHEGKYVFLGYFKDPRDAAEAYDLGVWKVKGEKGIYNFPGRFGLSGRI